MLGRFFPPEQYPSRLFCFLSFLCCNICHILRICFIPLWTLNLVDQEVNKGLPLQTSTG